MAHLKTGPTLPEVDWMCVWHHYGITWNSCGEQNISETARSLGRRLNEHQTLRGQMSWGVSGQSEEGQESHLHLTSENVFTQPQLHLLIKTIRWGSKLRKNGNADLELNHLSHTMWENKLDSELLQLSCVFYWALHLNATYTLVACR